MSLYYLFKISFELLLPKCLTNVFVSIFLLQEEQFCCQLVFLCQILSAAVSIYRCSLHKGAYSRTALWILSLYFMNNPIVWLNPGKIHLLVIQEEGESKVECCPPDLGVTFFFVLVLLWCQIYRPDKLMPKLCCCVTFTKVAINV